MNDEHSTGIADELIRTANALDRARDEYRALIALRDELIFQMIDAGYSQSEVARMAGVKPNQVSRMVTGNR